MDGIKGFGMKSRLGFVAVFLFLLALAFPLSRAQADSTLDIENPNCANFADLKACDDYLVNTSTNPFTTANPNEVEWIPSNQLGILQQSNAASSIDNPLLLIIGVPTQYAENGVSHTVTGYESPGITLSAGTGAIGSVGSYGDVYGGSWNTTTGKAAGNFTSGSVFDFLGLKGPANKSNSFTNWAEADQAVDGLTVTEFSIYVYELENTNINNNGGQQTVTVDFARDLNEGTFAAAYGQGSSGTIYVTKLTHAGLTTPEPNTMVLFGIGLALAGAFSFVRRRRANA